jgi:transposase
VERSFAHTCGSGNQRRTWLRGLENVQKRYLLTAAARNLGLIMCWRRSIVITKIGPS